VGEAVIYPYGVGHQWLVNDLPFIVAIAIAIAFAFSILIGAI